MFRFDHVAVIERVSLFRSRRGAVNKSRQILPGGEELEFITAGTGIFEDGTVQVEVGRGAVLWHLPGDWTISKFPPTDPYECLVVRFACRGPGPSGSERPRREVPRLSVWRDLGEASAFATEILRVYHRGGYDASVFTHYVYSRFLWQANVASQGQQRPFLPEALRRALDIVDERYRKDLTVETLADMVGYSVPHLHYLFRVHLATTPHHFLLERRVEQARRLLATTDLEVREVARQSGFSGPVTFSRAFRRSLGETPRAYRRAHAPPVG